MPGPNAPYTQLSFSQVITQCFNEAQDRLRVEGTVTFDSLTSSVAIADAVTGDPMSILADGSINVNTIISAADGDNLLILGTEDGALGGTKHVAKIGSDLNLRVKDEGVNTLLTSLLAEEQASVSIVNRFRNDYSSTNVTTGAYVQLLASTSAISKKFEVFDSSGETLVVAFGAAASEVDQFYIFPGGNGLVRYNIPSGTRISIKAISATANTGEISVNLYNN